jgi:hypothetical protein
LNVDAHRLAIGQNPLGGRNEQAARSGADFQNSLARLEVQIALRSLMRRFPKLHMQSNELRYKNQITIRGLAELRVGW